MANLFELVGSVAIDISDAEKKLDTLIAKADSLGSKLGGSTSVNVGGSNTTSGSSTKTTTTSKPTTTSGSGSDTDTSGIPTTIGGKGTSAGTIMLGNLATMGAHAVMSGFKKIYDVGTKFNANVETYSAQFETLLGTSPEEASAYVNRLRQFAKETPLSMEGTVQSAVRLLGAGLNSEEIFGVMQMLGDASLGDADRFERIAYAYSQIMSYGTLKAEESNQLTEAGVPIRLMLQEMLGMTGEELMDSQKKGEITKEMVTEAFQKAVSGELEIVNFEGGMEKAMNTYKGQKEKRDDAAEQAAGIFTKKLFEQNKGLMSWTTKYLEGFISADEEWGKQRIANENRRLDKAGQEALNADNMGTISGLAGKYSGWTDRQKNMAQMYASAYVNNSGVDWAKEQLALEVSDEEMQSVMADIHTLFRTYENPLELTQLMFTDDAAAELQRMVSAIPLTGTVRVTPIMSTGSSGGRFSIFGPNGSYANGLDRVPFDNYVANLHKGEAVLTAREAELWRSGGYRTDTSRLEAIMNQVLTGIQTIAGNTGAGQNIVLDSGVLVGQLAPGMNSQLGTLSKRRGRA